jgi:hypothetical protein
MSAVVPSTALKPLPIIRDEIEAASNELKGGNVVKAQQVCKSYLQSTSLVDEKILSSLSLLQARLLWSSSDMITKRAAVAHAVIATLADLRTRRRSFS